MKKIVVVGGAGFIGSNLVEALVEKGEDVYVIDNLFGGKRENVHPKASFYEIDICNYSDIEEIIAGADTVYHLAALPRVQFSIEYPIGANEVNVSGLLNVLVAANKGGVRRVVYSASSAAYGDVEKLPVGENTPINPVSPYGLQKYIGEMYCKMFSDVYGLSTVSLRYFNVYGKNQDPEGAYALVIAKFLKQKQDGEPITITGDGEQTRDFVHVRDVVRANMMAAEGENVGHGEVMNIGSGTNCSINRLAELIGGEIQHIEARLEPKNTLADVRLAKELLGWEPKVSFEDGIAELLKK
jgi:UDP-glucose 4-epimerase